MTRLALAMLGTLLLSSATLTTACAQETDSQAPPPLAGDAQTEDDQGTILENPFTFEGPMTAERLGTLVGRIDPNATNQGNGYTFTIQDRQLRVVYDEAANRMRIITPIIAVSTLPEGLLLRMLQANFDSVLDVRYAVGSGNVWATFVHPLSSLTDEDFISAVSQTTIAAETFGTSFTSGALVFGGGDSNGLNEELNERLRQAIEDGEDDRGI